MKIISTTGGIASTNSFVIADENTKEAVIFDAPDHTVAPLLDAIDKNGWKLKGLWLTHGHFDHTADHKVVTDRFPGARVLIHKLDEPKLQKPGSAMFQLPFVIPPRDADELIEDGKKLKIGGIEVVPMFTPGHSPGHIAFYLPGEKTLVGGDLIIGGAVGRTDLPDSNEDDFVASLKRITALPPETALLPGHGEISTIGDELESNQYLRYLISRAR